MRILNAIQLATVSVRDRLADDGRIQRLEGGPTPNVRGFDERWIALFRRILLWRLPVQRRFALFRRIMGRGEVTGLPQHYDHKPTGVQLGEIHGVTA